VLICVNQDPEGGTPETIDLAYTFILSDWNRQRQLPVRSCFAGQAAASGMILN